MNPKEDIRRKQIFTTLVSIIGSLTSSEFDFLINEILSSIIQYLNINPKFMARNLPKKYLALDFLTRAIKVIYTKETVVKQYYVTLDLGSLITNYINSTSV